MLVLSLTVILCCGLSKLLFMSDNGFYTIFCQGIANLDWRDNTICWSDCNCQTFIRDQTKGSFPCAYNIFWFHSVSQSFFPWFSWGIFFPLIHFPGCSYSYPDAVFSFQRWGPFFQPPSSPSSISMMRTCVIFKALKLWLLNRYFFLAFLGVLLVGFLVFVVSVYISYAAYPSYSDKVTLQPRKKIHGCWMFVEFNCWFTWRLGIILDYKVRFLHLNFCLLPFVCLDSILFGILNIIALYDYSHICLSVQRVRTKWLVH